MATALIPKEAPFHEVLCRVFSVFTGSLTGRSKCLSRALPRIAMFIFSCGARIISACFPLLTCLYEPHGRTQLWSRSIGLCWRERDLAATKGSPAEKFCANWLRPSTTLHRVNNPNEMPPLMVSAGSRRSVHVNVIIQGDNFLFERTDERGISSARHTRTFWCSNDIKTWAWVSGVDDT